MQPPPAGDGLDDTLGATLPPTENAAPKVMPPPADTNAPGRNPSPWGQVCGLLSLTSLDDIDPEKVRNSTAFKLGALAGLLPALSLMSLAQFLTPDQTGLLDTGSKDGGSILPAVGVLLSSALVGGAVAFFWAENRLRTIFTYGVAGPTVVLSMFLSGVGNVAANKRLENVKENSALELEKKTKEIHEAANQHLEGEIQKVVNATKLDMSSIPPTAPSADTHAAANPDLAPP